MNDDVKAFVSAVVYVRNNEDTLPDFLDAVANTLSKAFAFAEIICVDDASSDKSSSVIRSFAESHRDVCFSTVHMGHFHGREIAIRAGDDLAVGDCIIEFDSAILDFDPALICDAYAKQTEGFDVVSVVPTGKRRVTSRLFYKAINSSAEVANDLDTETFRILSRRALNRVESASQTIPYRKALYANSGLPQAVIQFEPLTHDDMKRTSKLFRRSERKYRLDVAVEAMLLFTKTGYKIALALSLFMMAVTLFMVVYALVCYVIGITVAGWTTTVLFLAFAFFGLFGILAIIIKYLQVIVNLIFKKKPYIFESIERY